jgi:hypothetical protein
MSDTCCLVTIRPEPAAPMTLFPRPVPVPANVAARPASRRKLWELPPHHHCVLLGAAFDARELRQVYRRAGYPQWETATDYQLHSSAVQHARTRNDVSRSLHKTLEERFGGAVAHLRAAQDREAVVVYWRYWAATDDPVGAYWAAITHLLCDADCDELLSREMHMLSHFAFAARRAAGRRLRARLAQSEHAARVACDALQRNANEEALHARDARIRSLEQALGAAQRAARAAEREMLALRAARDRAANEPAASSARLAPPEATERSAPPVDLARRTELCVGGKTRLVPHYRALVESSSGSFAHHDGGVEDHPSRLPSLLGAADAVVCLATDVSHCAYHAVKRYCKRFGKPCVLVGNSSVSALARSLAAVAANPTRR